MDPEAPFRLGVVAGNARAGHLQHEQPIQPLLAELVDVPEGGSRLLHFRVHLDRGYQPRFIFPNGMINVRSVFSSFVRRFPQFLPEDQRRASGLAPEAALQDALKAALCSPAFLYISTDEDKKRLSAYALAARLSHFLWSSMPDEALLRQASTGAPLQDEVLSVETRRLLSSPRAQAFVEGFLDSWLNLRSLGDMPPDRDAFGAYYWDNLQEAMKTETRLLMRHLLSESQSLHVLPSFH